GKNTSRPLKAPSGSESSRPIAAPRSAATCALWPHACAAPVAGSPSGCPATTRPSSSPRSANVGPSPPRPAASARTPVSASAVLGLRQRAENVSSTRRAVLTSLNPSSGCFRIRWPIPTICSARRSMAAYTRSFSSFFDMRAPFPSFARLARWGPIICSLRTVGPQPHDVLRLARRPHDVLRSHGRAGAILPAMDYHHVVEVAGAVALVLVFYSYTWRWFDPSESPRRARWRPVLNGVVFGLLAVFLMASRIQVGDGRFVDARAVPLALITLMEGPL